MSKKESGGNETVALMGTFLQTEPSVQFQGCVDTLVSSAGGLADTTAARQPGRKPTFWKTQQNLAY